MDWLEVQALREWAWTACIAIAGIYLATATWRNVLWILREQRRRRAEKEWHGQ